MASRLLWLALLGLAAGCDSSSSSPASSAAPPPASPPSAAAPSAAPAPPASTAAAAPDAPPPTTVAAQHILVAYKGAKGAPKTVTRSKADAKKRAEEVLAHVRAGEDFTELVKTYTDDPGSAERLGSVGKFTREKMDKAFSDAAFALKVDEVSGVVETPFGFHLIKRNQ
jgi:parvulin-like peptidyl-prolyl isomerase